MKKLLTLLVVLFIGGANLFSQVVTLDSTFESRCAESGRAYFSVTGGGPGELWVLDAYPAGYVPNPPSTLPYFLALPAGNYNCKYTLGGTTVNTPFTIAGTYIDPTFRIDTVLDALCPGEGEIHVHMDSGRTPYRYKLLHTDSLPGHWSAWQSTGTFTNLRSGNYDVQAEDSCGVIRTIASVFVAYPNGGPLGYNYHANTQQYYTDEAKNIPESCTKSTIGMFLHRNYAHQINNTLLIP